MKKIIILIVALILTGCVAEKVDEPNKFNFYYEGLEINLNANMKDIQARLPSVVNYTENESCAFNGIDKIYTFSDFEIYTYPKDNEDYVYQIYLISTNITTNEGIKLSDSKDKLISVYGDNYTTKGNEYSYIKDDTKLSFIVENNIITQICYEIILDENN